MFPFAGKLPRKSEPHIVNMTQSAPSKCRAGQCENVLAQSSNSLAPQAGTLTIPLSPFLSPEPRHSSPLLVSRSNMQTALAGTTFMRLFNLSPILSYHLAHIKPYPTSCPAAGVVGATTGTPESPRRTSAIPVHVMRATTAWRPYEDHARKGSVDSTASSNEDAGWGFGSANTPPQTPPAKPAAMVCAPSLQRTNPFVCSESDVL